jgi:hypothetical protein
MPFGTVDTQAACRQLVGDNAPGSKISGRTGPTVRCAVGAWTVKPEQTPQTRAGRLRVLDAFPQKQIASPCRTGFATMDEQRRVVIAG